VPSARAFAELGCSLPLANRTSKHVLPYLIAGLALGAIYSLAAAALVTTYISTGVLNFAFASTAYFIARFYYYLNSEQEWATWQAGLVAIVVCAPALGFALWAFLFRLLRLASQLTKIVATIGLSVALPALATVIFGNVAIAVSPGLAPLPIQVFHIAGATVTLDHVIVYVAVGTILVLGMVILRYTTAGLNVRAVVDSEAMTSLSGTNPSIVSAGVWMVTSFLAGLVGVLAAPLVGLDAGSYVLLIAAAFAAVIAAQLRSLPIAVISGIAIGMVGSIGQWLLPVNDPLTALIIPSVPFAFIVVFLVYYSIRRGRTAAEAARIGGPLDRAIQVQGLAMFKPPPRHAAAADGGSRFWTAAAFLHPRRVGPLVTIGVLTLFVSQLSTYWSARVGLAAAFAIVFLAFTLITGYGGMIWVCVISFAGVGAVATGQLATVYGWPVIPSLIVAGLITSAVGLVFGALTIRLGDLYVALSSLAFGLLFDFLIFHQQRFYQDGLGEGVPRPSFAESREGFAYFALAVFAILAITVANMSRSSMGLALSAVRSSDAASRTIGLSVVRVKLFVGALGAFVAGVGGGVLAVYSRQALPQEYETLTGLVWLAVIVTLGVRTPTAALVAGAAYAFMPAIFTVYLPASFSSVPTILFGVGAVLVAQNPDGVLAMHARQLDGLLERIGRLVRRPAAAAAVRVGQD
jgi:branched-chain amino acid transport system permease protein